MQNATLTRKIAQAERLSIAADRRYQKLSMLLVDTDRYPPGPKRAKLGKVVLSATYRMLRAHAAWQALRVSL